MKRSKPFRSDHSHVLFPLLLWVVEQPLSEKLMFPTGFSFQILLQGELTTSSLVIVRYEPKNTFSIFNLTDTRCFRARDRYSRVYELMVCLNQVKWKENGMCWREHSKCLTSFTSKTSLNYKAIQHALIHMHLNATCTITCVKRSRTHLQLKRNQHFYVFLQMHLCGWDSDTTFYRQSCFGGINTGSGLRLKLLCLLQRFF